MSVKRTDYALEDYYLTSILGSSDKLIANNLYGVNHLQTKDPIPMNKDMSGFVFIVRPQLNMQTANLRNLRGFSPLLTDNELSLPRFIRCTLDPMLMDGTSLYGDAALKCPLVNNKFPFIPVLTNNALSMSGFPDKITQLFTSKPGLYGEQYSMVDSQNNIYGSLDLDITFRNTKGDPIIAMMQVWNDYQTAVFEGKLVPYPDFIIENEIDYSSRIYRLVLDEHRNKVTKIAATGISYPVTVPYGSFFDFNVDTPLSTSTKDFSVRFSSIGVMYNDPILIHEFNQVVGIFNPEMREDSRQNNMTYVPKRFRHFFKNRGYPWINYDNHNLEWWVEKGVYERVMNRPLVKENKIILDRLHNALLSGHNIKA